MSAENNIVKIQKFLEGKNDDVKYVVNVETDADEKFATCVIHEPNKEKDIKKIEYTPFIYVKDLRKTGHVLFNGNKDKLEVMIVKHGITFKKMKTGNHSRLENGFPYKVTSSRSYGHILEFFKEAGLSPFQKIYDDRNKVIYNDRGFPASKNRHLFYLPKLNEQFFISTGIRLFKGFEEYNDIHKLTYDIETTGLRFEHSRIFAIGVKDNRGFEHVIEAEKDDDDASEVKIIQAFFNLVDMVKPAVISGYNSEMFDYEFILGRAGILEMDLSKLQTTIRPDKKLWRNKKATVKFGNTTEHYTSTIAYGYSILDIIHAVKKTAAVNTELKNNKLKYICKYEGIAKPNRMYIEGADIGRFWHQNPIFIVNKINNNYLEVPQKHTHTASELLLLQENKNKITDKEYDVAKKAVLSNDPDLVIWLRENTLKIFSDGVVNKDHFRFENGKDILRRYLLDDLWETEQVDNLYNQSSFLLAKIVPTVYSRVATMGNAAVWNLLMTAWSYENDLAIPHPDEVERFSGGLARCYKKGYTKRLLKIDYDGMYPMIQLTHDVFPMFDITGVIKDMLSYLTTTRNIYKKLARSVSLKDNEVELLKTIDHETYDKYVSNSFTKEERNLFKVKQLPIKILNNSLFGALGSGFAFNWSDNICAARITTTGRIYLRQAISWFSKYGLDPLLAVTDGINFGIPNLTNIIVKNEGDKIIRGLVPIEEAWQYNGEVGVSALIEKFNEEYMPKPYMGVDNDGEFDSCLNLSRINYALKTGMKIKFTGNTIKSKTMPEYIEEFIDNGMEYILNGDGEGFIDYYNDYAENIFYMQVPLKKIASKSRIKNSLDDYNNRGTDKNGKLKAKQAHMELILAEREKIARKLFEDDFEKFKDDTDVPMEEYSIFDIMEKVETYMPPEPELSSTVYYVNTGLRKSHGDVKADPKTGETIIRAKLINAKDLEENPKMIGNYNVEKYLAAFNKRAKVLLDGFDLEIRDDILVKIVRKKVEDASGSKVEQIELKKGEFNSDQLVLKNFVHDDYDNSMYLEDKEVEFWNKTGYDPSLIWDGFKTKDDEKHGLLYPEVYNHALNHLGDAMEKSGKPRVKSINDKLNKSDYVLIKTFTKVGDFIGKDTITQPINKNKPHIEGKHVFQIGKYWLRNRFDIGYNNGEFIEILREDVDIPLSPIENEWIETEKIKDIELSKLRVEDENYIKEQRESKEKERAEKIEYFRLFLIKYNQIPPHTDMDYFLKEVPNAKKAFEDFIRDKEIEYEPDVQYDEGDL